MSSSLGSAGGRNTITVTKDGCIARRRLSFAVAVGGGGGRQPDGADLHVTYTDGTTQKLVQNFSDWFQPQSFPGESRAVKWPIATWPMAPRHPHFLRL